MAHQVKTVQNKRAASGFTLIELLIGLAIMVIVLAMGMPSYGTWVQNTKLRNAAESFTNGLQLARANAVKRNSNVSFTLGVDSAWTVQCAGPVFTIACPVGNIESRATLEGSSDAVNVASASGTVFVFNSLGQLTAPVPVAPLTFIEIAVTNELTSGSRPLNVRVGIGGDVTMCDPSLAAASDARACGSTY